MAPTVKSPALTEKNQTGHIFFVTENYSPENTGVSAIINQYVQYVTRQGWPTTLLTAGAAVSPVPAGVGAVEFPLGPGRKNWRFPIKMSAYLKNINSAGGKIFHLHGAWGAPQLLAARTAAHRGIPALLTPHDSLSPWPWQRGRLRRLKKLIYWHTFAYPAFRHLTLIHVNTAQERDELAHLFPGQRIEVIPNGIDLPEVDNLISESSRELLPSIDRPFLLFLGRLHPQKGVDLLIEAFGQVVKERDFRLAIVGPETVPAYAHSLKSRVNLLGLDRKVVFLGPIFGPQKWRLIREAWACCLPSRSEGMSQVSLEIAAAGTPFVTTYEAKILDWQEGGGLLVHARVEELARALEQIFSWKEQERQERGRKLRQLVERRYSWEAVGSRWLELYSELLKL